MKILPLKMLKNWIQNIIFAFIKPNVKMVLKNDLKNAACKVNKLAKKASDKTWKIKENLL